MPETTFAVEARVAVAPADAVDFLMDLAHHHGLHPFLVSARVVASGSGPEGDWWQWRVLERPPLGPLRYPVRFPARLVRTSTTSMRAEVRAAPGCTLRSVTRAEASPDGTVLRETTVVQAPRLLLGYMAREARAAHVQTYERLPGVLAGGR